MRFYMQFVKGDITSADLIRHILQSEAIDTIVHFAAQVSGNLLVEVAFCIGCGLQFSYKCQGCRPGPEFCMFQFWWQRVVKKELGPLSNPLGVVQSHCDHLFGNSLSFTLNDTYGTHVLLESSRVYGAIGRFVNVSTDAVFGEATWETSTPLNDKTVLKPTNPYSASKAAVEMMVKAFVNSYHLPCITVRANNVYGPRQYPEKLIPKMILLATRQKDLPIHGTGENMHRYVYVEDVAEAFDLVIHKGIAGDTYNIGTAHEQSVKKIVEAIAARVGLGSNKITYVKERAFISDRSVWWACFPDIVVCSEGMAISTWPLQFRPLQCPISRTECVTLVGNILFIGIICCVEKHWKELDGLRAHLGMMA